MATATTTTLLLLLISCQSITLPLTITTLNSSRPSITPRASHQTAITKPLRSLRAVFTISLLAGGKAYDMTVDTGSSDFFIKGETMTGIPSNKYQCAACMRDYPKTTLAYLDGIVDAYVQTVNVTLTSRIRFQERIYVGYRSSTRNFDYMGGILGLSLKNTIEGQYSFLQTLSSNNIIKQKIFAVKLNFKKANQSFITFGSFDPRFLAPNATIRYYRVIDVQNSFTIATVGVFVGDYVLPISQALLDTGNTCITFPDMYSQEILDTFQHGGNLCTFQQQPGNTRFHIMLCRVSDFYAFPILKFLINREIYQIGPEYYIQKCRRIANPTDSFTHNCQTLIQTVTTFDYMFLGATFFLKYYGIFNLDRNIIGLARNNDKTLLAQVTRELW